MQATPRGEGGKFWRGRPLEELKALVHRRGQREEPGIFDRPSARHSRAVKTYSFLPPALYWLLRSLSFYNPKGDTHTADLLCRQGTAEGGWHRAQSSKLSAHLSVERSWRSQAERAAAFPSPFFRSQSRGRACERPTQQPASLGRKVLNPKENSGSLDSGVGRLTTDRNHHQIKFQCTCDLRKGEVDAKLVQPSLTKSGVYSMLIKPPVAKHTRRWVCSGPDVNNVIL